MADSLEETTGQAKPGQGWTPTGGAAMESSLSQAENDGAVKVVVRVRPPLPRELSGYQPYRNAVAVDPNSKVITLSENLSSLANNGVEGGVLYNSYRFAFDAVYGPESTQAQVYEQCARPAVVNVLQGYNASIIAYGQTGTGKTFTMEGSEIGDGAGIIPRAIEEVFSSIARDTGERCRFLVRASYLQIYNETISDLLKPSSTGGGLGVREDRRRGVRVEGLSEWVVRSPAEVAVLMRKGAVARTTGATKLNELSSRSHAIFTLTVEKAVFTEESGEEGAALRSALELADAGPDDDGPSRRRRLRQKVRVGKLNLVDLAGSERVHVTGATGQRLEESKKINQSLSTLGNVISALASENNPKRAGNHTAHVPYRESKLTRILEDSLGGNCVTTFLGMISPAVEAFSESLSTLKFANRAKNVRNAPTVNEDLDQRTLLRKYEQELRRLRAELQQKSKDLVDKRLLLELDAARKREQADKLAAISALERQSAEIMRHKAAMAALESRIRHMQSQLLEGGHRLEDTPQFRQLLAAEQERIRSRYASRLAELEAEREVMAQGQAQIDRYRVLLTKQRDVMTALTQRLGERDEQVLALQADLDAVREKERQLEDRLDTKTAELLALQRAATEKRNGSVLAAEELRQDGNEVTNHQVRQATARNSSERQREDDFEEDPWQIAAVRRNQERVATPAGPILVESAGDSVSEAGSSAAGSFGNDTKTTHSQDDGGEEHVSKHDEETLLRKPVAVHAPTTSSTVFFDAGEKAGTPTAVASANAIASKFDVSVLAQNDRSIISPSTSVLQNKIQSMQQERRALKAILENKVAAVMNDAGKSLQAQPEGSVSDETAKKVAAQLAYVQSVVSATLSALSTEQGP